jgi:hypothetical protein
MTASKPSGAIYWLRGIIQRMLLLIEAYKAIKYLDKTERYFAKLGDLDPGNESLITGLAFGSAKQGYHKYESFTSGKIKEKRRKIGYHRVNNAFGYALKKKCVKVEPIMRATPIMKKNGEVEYKKPEAVDTVTITLKGYRLLDTIPFLPFLPYGLIRALWEDDPLLVKLIILAATAIGSYFGADFISTLFKAIIGKG